MDPLHTSHCSKQQLKTRLEEIFVMMFFLLFFFSRIRFGCFNFPRRSVMIAADVCKTSPQNQERWSSIQEQGDVQQAHSRWHNSSTLSTAYHSSCAGDQLLIRPQPHHISLTYHVSHITYLLLCLQLHYSDRDLLLLLYSSYSFRRLRWCFFNKELHYNVRFICGLFRSPLSLSSPFVLKLTDVLTSSFTVDLSTFLHKTLFERSTKKRKYKRKLLPHIYTVI